MTNKKKLYKVFSTSVVAAMVAVSLGAGAGQAEGNEQVLAENVEKIVLQENGTETVQTTETTVTNEVELNQEEMALLPGDLFYFIKSITEKIKLALVNNEIDKAKLLVQFTQDRLNEAEELFEKGEEGLAYDTLKKALELQGLALEYSNEDSEENISDEETASDEATSGDTADEEVVELVSSEEEGSTSAEDAESDSSTDTATTELQEGFANNVHGLLNAMQNVKNPTALKALARNLEKQAEKYEKSYGKLLKAEAEYTKVIAEIEEKAELGHISKEEAVNKINEVEKELVKTQQEVKSEVEVELEKESAAVKAEVETAIAEEEKNNSKDKAKVEEEKAKFEEKQNKEQLKEERKAIQEEYKAQKKQLQQERKLEQQKEIKNKNEKVNE